MLLTSEDYGWEWRGVDTRVCRRWLPVWLPGMWANPHVRPLLASWSAPSQLASLN
jgi:hypothetical protein